MLLPRGTVVVAIMAHLGSSWLHLGPMLDHLGSPKPPQISFGSPEAPRAGQLCVAFVSRRDRFLVFSRRKSGGHISSWKMLNRSLLKKNATQSWPFWRLPKSPQNLNYPVGNPFVSHYPRAKSILKKTSFSPNEIRKNVITLICFLS